MVEQIGRTTERATDYGTKQALAGRFFRHPSARLLLGSAAAALIARIVAGLAGIGPWSVADVLAGLTAVAMIGIVEWFAHQKLFHAPPGTRRADRFKTGHSHRRHHLDPTDMGWVLLHPRGARDLMIGVGVLALSWSIPLALLTGVSPLGPYLTTVLIGWLAIAHYEWTHLMVHSRYRPTSRYYRRLAKNHRRHHYRNETQWLGVTTNLGDRVFGTLPGPDDDVPLSDTARTLSRHG